LTQKDFTVQAQAHWTSPVSGRQYPVKWQIHLPKTGISGTAIAVIKNQEHLKPFPYWEGAAVFAGNGLDGAGYIELTGY
jgi:predicted secreted hydrolase